MKEYVVTGDFSYIQNAESTEEIISSLRRVLKREGLEESNFEITINGNASKTKQVTTAPELPKTPTAMKVEEVELEEEEVEIETLPVPVKKRGRPAGSKNSKKKVVRRK